MQKYIFVLFALFAVLNSAWCDSSEEVLEKVKSKHLKKYLSNNKDQVESGLEKLNEYCPGVSEKLKKAVVEFQQCDENTDESLTICEAIQAYTLNCTRPILQVVDDCLPQKSKGLPFLGVKSLLSVAQFLCKQPGELIFELANPCIWEDNEEPTECDQKIEEIASKYKSKHTLPSQSEVCSSVISLKSCIKADSEAACKNPKTRNVISGIYDALIAPCSNINEV